METCRTAPRGCHPSSTAQMEASAERLSRPKAARGAAGTGAAPVPPLKENALLKKAKLAKQRKPRSDWEPFEVRSYASASTPFRKFRDVGEIVRRSPAVEDAAAPVRPPGESENLRDYMDYLIALELVEGQQHNEKLKESYSPPPAPSASDPGSPEAERQELARLQQTRHVVSSSADGRRLRPEFEEDELIVLPVPRRDLLTGSAPISNHGSQHNVDSFVMTHSTSPLSSSSPRGSSIYPRQQQQQSFAGLSPVVSDPAFTYPSRVLGEVPVTVDAVCHGAGCGRVPVLVTVTLSALFRYPLVLNHIRSHEPAGGLTVGDANFLEWISRVYPRKYQNCVQGAQYIRIENYPWLDFRPGKFEYRLDEEDHVWLDVAVLFPLFLFGKERMELALHGATDREGFPVAEHMCTALPFLCECAGAKFDLSVESRSLTPTRTSTIVMKSLSVVRYLRPLNLVERRPIVGVSGKAIFGRGTHKSTGSVILEKIQSLVQTRYRSKLPCKMDCSFVRAEGFHFGVVFFIETMAAPGDVSLPQVVCFSAFRNNTGFHHPGTLAEAAVEHLARAIAVPYCVDADALLPALVVMTLAKGRSRIRTVKPSMQALVMMQYLELMSGVKFSVSREAVAHSESHRLREELLRDVTLRWEDTYVVEVDGVGFENPFAF